MFSFATESQAENTSSESTSAKGTPHHGPASSTTHARPRAGAGPGMLRVQARLQARGAYDDAAEHEAEHMAGQVLGGNAATPTSAPGSNAAVSSALHQQIGTGQPLSLESQAFFGSRFGADFSQVRVHSDHRAATAAASIGADAYTHRHQIVFAQDQYQPDTQHGQRLLAHELGHVLQQRTSGQAAIQAKIRLGAGPLTVNDKYKQIVHQTWGENAEKQLTRLHEADQTFSFASWKELIHEYECAKQHSGPLPSDRDGKPLLCSQSTGPGTPPPALPAASPLPGPPERIAAPANAPTVSMVASGQNVPPSTQIVPPAAPKPVPTPEPPGQGRLESLEPNEATRQRLLDIITKGGSLPNETRVIAAAIVEIEGYTGRKEIRAISGQATDTLGANQPVGHAVTPPNRTLQVARSIGSPHLRGEFPFSHVNDAEIKIFEEVIANMQGLPPGAKGRVSFLTLRSRQGGKILEPIAACSSCNNATFQLAGQLGTNIQIASYAVAHPTTSLDLNADPAPKLPGNLPKPAQTPPGAPANANQGDARQEESKGGLRAEVGMPDMRGLEVGGPSARGEGIVAGINVAFMGANFVLNLINDHIQEKKANAALKEIEPALQSDRTAHPDHGVLLYFYYSQYEAPEESIIRPGAVFSHLEYAIGRTNDEARIAHASQAAIRPGGGPNTQISSQQVWIKPLVAPSISAIIAPFHKVAIGTFASGGAVLQDVEWGGITGFDDEGTSTPKLIAGQSAKFFILQLPRNLTYSIGGYPQKAVIPVEQRAAKSGGNVPVVNLDPDIPFGHVAAACIFPADDATEQMFRGTRKTHDETGQLDIYPNIAKARWIRPENVEVLERL